MGILLECFCTAERVFAPYANAWPEKTVTWECVSIRRDPKDSWRDRKPF